MGEVLNAITAFAIGLASSPWIFPLVFALTVFDAFLVIVPSETVVVALGALAASSGNPNLAVLAPVAAAAAVLGDTLTFAVGRAIGTHRPGWMSRGRIAAALDWAGRALDRRTVVVLLTARFVPFGLANPRHQVAAIDRQRGIQRRELALIVGERAPRGGEVALQRA